jgi:hypothetical protein
MQMALVLFVLIAAVGGMKFSALFRGRIPFVLL